MSTHLPRITRRRRHAGVALSLAAALTLAACGGDGGDDEPGAQHTEGATTLEAVSPLTGLKLDSTPDHPIVVVKIDNSRASAPQVGLGKADLVTEELVEGGITRLAVFYDSSIPKMVGPVRSMRATDIGIVQPAKATLVASGGAPQTVVRVMQAGITTVTEGAEGYYRESSRYAPYNLFMRLRELTKGLDGDRPARYLPFGDEADFPQGQRARGLDASFSGNSSTGWRFDGAKYVNTAGFAAEGDRFEPDTVLVLRVRVGDAGYRDPAGNPVPETVFTGKGKAMVFHDGRLVRGTWSKKGLDGQLTLATAAGELRLPPGRVWIALVPAQGGNVVVHK